SRRQCAARAQDQGAIGGRIDAIANRESASASTSSRSFYRELFCHAAGLNLASWCIGGNGGAKTRRKPKGSRERFPHRNLKSCHRLHQPAVNGAPGPLRGKPRERGLRRQV